MRGIPFHDLVAGLAALMLVAGILALVFVGRPVPDFLSHAFTMALAWAARGGVQAANDLRHRNRS